MDEKTAVQNGIEWFESHGFTDWYKRINVTTLDIETTTDCPAGQVLGSYHVLQEKYDMELGVRSANGFTCAPLGGRSMSYAKLEQAWKDAILLRLSADANAPAEVAVPAITLTESSLRSMLGMLAVDILQSAVIEVDGVQITVKR